MNALTPFPEARRAQAPDTTGEALFRRAQAVATEHVIWAALQGQRPEDILAALGVPARDGGWEEARVAIACAWLALRREDAG